MPRIGCICGTNQVIRQETAESLALGALSWMISQTDIIERFLGESGLSPGDLAIAATEPEFLAAVVDFILTQDDWVIAASAALDLSATRFVELRAALPGGAVPDWT